MLLSNSISKVKVNNFNFVNVTEIFKAITWKDVTEQVNFDLKSSIEINYCLYVPEKTSTSGSET